jgi:hypothetical protein
MNRLKVALLVLLLALATSAIALPGAARADGAWLDSQPVANWNQAGMALPMAPPPGTPIDPRFAARERTPESNEDQALVANGWRLFTSYQAGWGIRVIPATAYYDGMGRPWQYQVFVFVDGVFAGTLSPQLMDSRTDGALDQAQLTDSTSMFAEFRRVAATDPLCCPSGSATVIYRIDRSPAGPVVAPDTVTSSTTAPPAGSTAAPAPTTAPAAPSPAATAPPAVMTPIPTQSPSDAAREALDKLGP